jgi:basic membrane protein A
MKKLVALVIVLCLALSLFAVAGCAPKTEEPAQSASAETPAEVSEQPTEAPSVAPSESAAAEGAEVAMITDKGTIDDKSFNQGTWEGVQKYCSDNNISCKYYKPAEATSAAYLESIALAVQGGAKVVVTPGFLFEVPIYEAQTTYPDVTFILLDGEPHTEDYATYKTESNVLCILFAEEQAGFFAGYASVKDGFTKLGFQGGMAVPAVIRYGYGFLQGAEAAAKEMGLAEGSISVMYNYYGDFAATPENQARAAGWYQSGTEVIFGCGGSVGNSVMAAAEASTDKFVIGVDVDQYAESATVISSAMKLLGNAVYQALDSYYGGSFEGGQTWTLNATNDGVGLAMDNAKWRTFAKADYDKLFAAVKDGTFKVNNASDIKIADLGLKYVKVTEVTD